MLARTLGIITLSFVAVVLVIMLLALLAVPVVHVVVAFADRLL